MVKQVIVVRKDLNMRKGKIAAQVAHASMAVILRMMSITKSHGSVIRTLTTTDALPVEQWLSGSFTKVCVSVDSEQELTQLQQLADDAGICNALITDNGRTEFHGIPTVTCLAIGPCTASDVDAITGHLKLL